LNTAIMDKYQPEPKKYDDDPSRCKSWLEQLGTTYPTAK